VPARLRRKVLLYLIVALAPVTPVRAAETAWTVHGRTFEQASKKPLAGVVVSVRDNAALTAVTDADGRFELRFSAPGAYVLVATALGAEAPALLDIRVGQDAPAPVFHIAVATVLPEIVVTAERNPDRVGKTVIRGEELRQVAGSAGDPMKAVQSLPGIAVASDASSEPAVRGSGPGDNAYYVDGLPVGYLFHVGGYVSVINADLVDDFNLHSAAFGPEYADVSGAVLDVALRNPRNDRVGGKINVSLLGADFLAEGPVAPDQSFYFAARRSYFDLVADEIKNDDTGVTVEVPRYYDYQGKYLWHVNGGNSLTLHLGGAGDHISLEVPDDTDIARQDPVLSGTSMSDTSYDTQAVSWDSSSGTDLSNRLSLGHSTTRERLIVGAAGNLSVDYDSVFLREQFRFVTGPAHEVFLGGSREVLRVDVNIDSNNPLCTQFDPDCDYTSAARHRIDDRFNVNRWDIFAKDRWHILPRWTLVGGARYSSEDYLQRSYTEPRVGLEWEWSDRTLLTAGWGRHNQFPAGDQVLREFGNPELHHIRADHSVLGIAQKLDDGWSWKAETYYKKFDDLVVSDPLLNYVNGASGTAYGLELLIKKNATAKLSGWLSLSLSRSQRQNDVTGESFPFSYDQPVIAVLVGNYRISEKWQLGTRWNYHSGTPYTPIVGTGTYPDGRVRPLYGPINSERLPDYHRLDLRLDREFSRRVKGYVEIINAYAHKNVGGYRYNADFSERKPVYQLPPLISFGVQTTF
jgi:hypothetical protein